MKPTAATHHNRYSTEGPAMTIPEQAVAAEERHYLSAVLLRLKTLYDLTKESNVREPISDEVDWIEARLAALPLVGVERPALPPLRAREEIARIIADELGEPFDALPAEPHFDTDYCQDDFLRCADALLSSTAGQEWRDISTEEKSHAELLAEARAAVERLVDWCDFNEVKWTGWGDQIVPQGAIDMTAEARRIRDAFPAPPVAEPIVVEKKIK
jgi:hypothetical protein